MSVYHDIFELACRQNQSFLTRKGPTCTSKAIGLYLFLLFAFCCPFSILKQQKNISLQVEKMRDFIDLERLGEEVHVHYIFSHLVFVNDHIKVKSCWSTSAKA